MTNPKYGAAHQKLRAEWKVQVEQGGIHCHHLPACLEPDTRIHPGSKWDLGHRDDDPTQYTGPEHPRCNRGTARIWKQRAEQTTTYGWFV